MNTKAQTLSLLQAEFQQWEDLLASLNEAQINAPQPGGNLSIKDVIAHLHAWQQVSVARLTAAQQHQEPHFPDWLAGADPEAEEETDHFNARIYAIYQHQTWAEVYQTWRAGFLRFLELAAEIPEADLLDRTKYPWLKGYALLDVLQGSCEHHAEHREPLQAQVTRITAQ